MRTSKPISISLAMPDEVLRERVNASIADGRPSVPAGVAFKRLRAHHDRRVKAAKGSAKSPF